MKTVALIGANGFVGSEITNALINEKRYSFIPVTRQDNLEEAIKKAEVVIYAANSGKRFFAENNPEIDFDESVEKTAIIKKLSINKRLILISSISARTQLNTVYGRNRRACELIADTENSLIVRLGPMYGAGKSIGVLNDIINNKKVYAAPSTEYAFVDVKYNAQKIVSFINNNSVKGIIEIGAKNGISLESLRNTLQSTSTFEGEDDTQIPISPANDAPDVNAVISFAKSIIEYKK
jgi:nucleoside-diphosphate-sugar epimerase